MCGSGPCIFYGAFFYFLVSWSLSCSIVAVVSKKIVACTTKESKVISPALRLASLVVVYPLIAISHVAMLIVQSYECTEEVSTLVATVAQSNYSINIISGNFELT